MHGRAQVTAGKKHFLSTPLQPRPAPAAALTLASALAFPPAIGPAAPTGGAAATSSVPCAARARETRGQSLVNS